MSNVVDCDDSTYNVDNNCDLLIEYCSGFMQVYVEDNSGNALENIKIKMEGIDSGVTDNFGQKTFSFGNTNVCHENVEFEVYCSDNTFCGSGQVDLDDSDPSELDSVSFDCSVCVPQIKDLSFDRETLRVTENSISIDVNSLSIEGVVKASLYLQDETGLRNENDIKNESIAVYKNQGNLLSFTGLDLSDVEYFHIYIE